jgi:hypothetical protein
MGGLIMTKGTKRLAAHYNDEFDTWLTFYRTTALPYFNRGAGVNVDIWNDIIQVVTDNTAGHSARPSPHLTLLPRDHPAHAHLHARWRFFLQNDFAASQNDLVDAIYAALTKKPHIAYILFDVRQGGPVPTPPYVTLAYGTDPDGVTPIATITIVVAAAMSTGGPGGHNPDTID